MKERRFVHEQDFWQGRGELHFRDVLGTTNSAGQGRFRLRLVSFLLLY